MIKQITLDTTGYLDHTFTMIQVREVEPNVTEVLLGHAPVGVVRLIDGQWTVQNYENNLDYAHEREADGVAHLVRVAGKKFADDLARTWI